MVLISLRMKPYHSAFRQSAEHAMRLYQPIWSKSELESHQVALFKGQSKESVQNAHDLLVKCAMVEALLPACRRGQEAR